MINCEDIQKVLPFLETLKEDQFVKFEQTLDFEPKNIGKFHCVLGHMFVNPNSPLYGTLPLWTDKTRADTGAQIGLVEANNYAPKGQIKSSVIGYLKELCS